MTTPDSLPYSSESSDHSCTPSERAKSRRYLIELGIAAAVYTVTILVSSSTVDHVSGMSKVVVALLPMLGVVAMVLALVRFIARVDELQREMVVLAGSIAGVGTALITMTLGFLENAGVPRISMTWVWPISCAIFGVALPIVRRRFR